MQAPVLCPLLITARPERLVNGISFSRKFCVTSDDAHRSLNRRRFNKHENKENRCEN